MSDSFASDSVDLAGDAEHLLGSDEPSRSVQTEIESVLANDSTRLGQVFLRLREGVTADSDIVELGAAANTGHASNMRSTIAALTRGTIPNSPSRAKMAAGSARKLLASNRSTLSFEAKTYLEVLIERLNDVAASPTAQEREIEELEQASHHLEQELESSSGGVYVFTYPHYFQHPYTVDPERFLLKVGMTRTEPFQRVRAQARQTGMPELPVLLRVYRSQDHDPAELERKYHQLLDAADHPRGPAGKEWFATRLDFLDTIAQVLGLDTILGAEG